jgi:hypothetical protein
MAFFKTTASGDDVNRLQPLLFPCLPYPAAAGVELGHAIGTDLVFVMLAIVLECFSRIEHHR